MREYIMMVWSCRRMNDGQLVKRMNSSEGVGN